jgi:hypothetical protein
MANLIKFLRGSQGSLNNLITSGDSKNVAGAFYLTEDTNRLYIGKTIDGKVVPVPVNQGVVYVANIDALPSGDAAAAVKTGEFYYAEAENILCVRSAGKWIQINTPYDDKELKEVIAEINDAISGINQTLDTKANLAAPAFTGKATLSLTKEEITDKNQLVTKEYVDAAVLGADMTEYIDGKVEDINDRIDSEVETINGAIAGVSATANAADKLSKDNAKLIGELKDTNTDTTTVVGYVNAVKATAEAAAKASDVETTVNGINDEIDGIKEDISGINQTLDTKANLADADFTKASIGGKAIATEDYADGIAEDKADAVKEAILGDAETYTDLGKVETKITLLEEADAGLQGQIDKIKGNVENLSNVMTFVGTTTTEITDGATTKPIAITGNASYTPDAGDVVIYSGEEFVWTGSSWAQIGSANATTAVLEALEERIDDIDGENGAIATINTTLETLEEADSGINGRIDALVETVGDNKDAFDAHVVTYNAYVSTNNAAVQKVGNDLAKAVEDLGKEDDTLAEAIATEKAAREKLAKDLEWGSF